MRRRVEELGETGELSLERVCYTLLTGTWRPIELDFLLAVSPRVRDILLGGGDPLNRPARQAELELGRAATMLGMLHQRLEQAPPRRDDAAEVVEDERQPIRWEILPELGAARFEGLAPGPLPWSDGAVPDDGALADPATFERVAPGLYRLRR